MEIQKLLTAAQLERYLAPHTDVALVGEGRSVQSEKFMERSILLN
jgi:hypothetical protein